MTVPVTLTLENAHRLAETALTASGAAPAAAASVARALVAAEADGQAGHGLTRVPSYAQQLRAGKVNGNATARAERVASGLLRVDAGHGFAYPALDLAIERLPELVREAGVAVAAIRHSHHFGQAGAPCERLAAAGFVCLLFGNTPKAMAPWGGSRPLLGTNPIAFAAPMPDAPPLVIDLALSRVARGRVLAAEKKGGAIPEGWALDADGNPTTDPSRALAGTMLPAGDAKGAALALMVEILSAALVGGNFGFEASSFLNAEGPPPNVAQTLLAIDPERLSGGVFLQRMATLATAFAEDPDARFPGTRRLAARERAAREGLAVAPALVVEIEALGTSK